MGTRTTSLGRGLCAATALAALVAVPATAEAKKAAPLRQATFRATLSGSQVTTWEYHHARDQSNPCDASANGNGDQTIEFRGGRSFKVTFTRPPKNEPDLFQTDGRPAVLTTPLFFNVKATATRNGEESVNAADLNSCPGDNGGADAGSTPPPPDCGVRHGIFRTRLYFHDNSEEGGLFVPIPGGDERNRLSLEGTSYGWNAADGASEESELRNTYERCPFHLADAFPDDAGQIYLSRAKLSEKQLFDRKRKRFVVSGDHVGKHSGDETTGQTILAWNLHLTRVKR